MLRAANTMGKASLFNCAGNCSGDTIRFAVLDSRFLFEKQQRIVFTQAADGLISPSAACQGFLTGDDQRQILRAIIVKLIQDRLIDPAIQHDQRLIVCQDPGYSRPFAQGVGGIANFAGAVGAANAHKQFDQGRFVDRQPKNGLLRLLYINVGDGCGDRRFTDARGAVQDQGLVLSQSQEERPQQVVAPDGSPEAPQWQIVNRADGGFQGLSSAIFPPKMM